MSRAQFSGVLSYLRRTCHAQADRDLSDGELLDRFLERREQAAFAVLVQRHGPMVLSLCRRMLGDEHNAEDAFQATFLVLARRAASIRKKESLANWLHGVARRISAKSRIQAAARRSRERQAAMGSRNPEALDELSWQELREVLDEEIGRLPEKYRSAIVLCYLEGKSYDQAARGLRCPKSSLASRLLRARTLLRQHLARRGIALSAAALTTAFSAKAASVPLSARLTLNAVQAATAVIAGKAVAGIYVSARAATIAAEALPSLAGMKGRLLILMLAFALLGGGGSLAVRLALADDAAPVSAAPPTIAQAPASKSGPTRRQPRERRSDVFGDPLPDGATVRLGTIRLRHGTSGTRIAFALGGKMVVSLGGDVFGGWDMRLWDTMTGRLLRRFPGISGSPAISPDGKWMVTNERRLFDVALGKELRQFKGPAGYSPCVVFSPDSKIVAATDSQRGRILLWDAATGRELHWLKSHDGQVSSLDFSADSKVLASASPEGTIVLWNVDSGKEVRRIQSEKPAISYQQTAVWFSPAGNVLASSNGRAVRLWHTENGKVLHRLQGVDQIAFSPDGKLLAGAGTGGMLRLFEVATGQELRHWLASQRIVSYIAFTPDGKGIASSGWQDHAIRFWEVASGKELRPFPGHGGVVMSVRFSADGKHLVSSAEDGKVVEWDLASARETGRLFRGAHVPGLSSRAYGLSPNGKVLAAPGVVRTVGGLQDDGVVHLWDTTTGKELCTLQGIEWVRSLQFGPGGKLVAMDSKEGIQVCDAATGKRLFHIAGQRPHSGTLIFSPDGKSLAWGGDGPLNGVVHVWDMATQKLRRWPARQRKTRVLAFTPDGRSIAGADRGDIRIWNTATGKEQMSFRGPSWVESLAFSASGRVLAAGGELGQIHLWEVPTRQEIRRITGPQGTIPCLAFAPDGRTLASGGGDTTILLWDLTGAANSTTRISDLDRLWSDLAADAAKAYAAIWTFTRTPNDSVSYLKGKLHPAAPADAKHVARLIADLESKTFTVRDQATRELEKLGEAAEPGLRKLLADNPPLEVRQRVERVLQKRGKDVLRQQRAIEALELIATREARQALASLAQIASHRQVAQTAAEAAERLRGR